MNSRQAAALGIRTISIYILLLQAQYILNDIVTAVMIFQSPVDPSIDPFHPTLIGTVIGSIGSSVLVVTIGILLWVFAWKIAIVVFSDKGEIPVNEKNGITTEKIIAISAAAFGVFIIIQSFPIVAKSLGRAWLFLDVGGMDSLTSSAAYPSILSHFASFVARVAIGVLLLLWSRFIYITKLAEVTDEPTVESIGG
jgi:hypothetical protein